MSVVPLNVAEKTTGEVLCSRLGDCSLGAVPSPLMDRTCTPLPGPSDLWEGREREGKGEGEEGEREREREREREGERGKRVERKESYQ